MPSREHIAIFVSGTGSNARRIIEHFSSHPDIEVALLVSNKSSAPALEMAKAAGIDTLVIDRAAFSNGQDLLRTLREHRISFIALAGFLWLIPVWLIRAFPQRIVNIHPSLLPKFGGQGMFGHHVHQAVIDAGELQSGISIHFVNEVYDEGGIIFQAVCPVLPDDTPERLAKRVLLLEHKHYPNVIEQLLREGGSELQIERAVCD